MGTDGVPASRAALRHDGRIIVISGAGRGLGRAYAEHLAAHGARVVVNDLDAAAADEVAAATPGTVACAADVSTAAGARLVLDAALELGGRLDAIVANAGTSWHLPFAEASADDLAAVLTANLATTWHLVREAWPRLVAQGHGRIVTTASGAVFGFAGRAHYGAAKGAVLALTNTLAIEGAPHGIAANTVLPWGATRLARPGSRAPDPAEAAPAVAWLCHESCPENGAAFTVGQGRIARVRVEVGPAEPFV